ncbi:hypothetical protein N824_12390 [Pedobacter sp. V48]|nr:hypothetical protein N824_12390 [Pedobacter sp. V48]
MVNLQIKTLQKNPILDFKYNSKPGRASHKEMKES